MKYRADILYMKEAQEGEEEKVQSLSVCVSLCQCVSDDFFSLIFLVKN